LGFIAANQLACLNLLTPPADPKRESPLRAVYQTAAELMVSVIADEISDVEYEGAVTGLISTALLLGRPLPSNLRLSLGKLLALTPRDRSKDASSVLSLTRIEFADERADAYLIQRLLASLTAVISAHEGTTS